MHLKKWMAGVLTLCMLLTTLPGALAAVSSSSGGQCSAEEAAMRNQGQHLWNWIAGQAATCTQDGYEVYQCAYCNQQRREIISATGHNWAQRDDVPPTCTEEGYSEVYCTNCGESYDRIYPALGHDWRQLPGGTASCTEWGLAIYQCARCGEAYENEAPPLGHDWRETARHEGKCNEDGYVEYTCSRCGATYRESIPGGKHDFGPWEADEPSTCITFGTEVHVCKRCGYKEWRRNYTPGDHVWGEWHVVREPSPQGPGLMRRECQVCGLVEEKEIPYDPAVTAVPGGVPNITEVPGNTTSITETPGYYLVPDVTPLPNNPAPDPSFNEGKPQLTLIVTQITPMKEAYKYADGGDAETITYSVGLMNTGDVPLDIHSVVWLNNMSVAGSLIDYGAHPIHLEPMMYAENVGSIQLWSWHIMPGTASENRAGTILPSFYADGYQPGTNNVICTSNEVWFEYVIDIPQKGTTTWELPPVTDETSITVVKEEISTSADFLGYMEGETIRYRLTVTNNTDYTFASVGLGDSLMNDGAGSEEVTTLYNVLPHETRTFEYEYVVQAHDVTRSYIYNIAYASWNDPVTGKEVLSYSNSVTVNVIDTEHGIELLKRVVGAPANGLYYTVGEAIHFEIVVTNISLKPLYEVVVYDPLVVEEEMGDRLAHFSQLNPGESEILDLLYVVTDMDVLMGEVVNEAAGLAMDQYANIYHFISNEVVVPTGGTPFGVITGLDVSKTETSTPKNGSYYTLGETITYDITIINIGETTMEVIVYDSLKTSGFGEIASIENFFPGASRTIGYSHQVTAEDVDAGCVVNYAMCSYTLISGAYGMQKSNEVISKTSEGTPVPDKKINVPATGVGESCLRTLTGQGSGAAAYTLRYCAQHAQTAQKVEALLALAPASNTQAVWQQAREMWRAEVDSLYETYLSGATSSARATVLDDRMAYYLYLGSYEALLNSVMPDQPALVAQKVAEQLMNRCVDLCYALHHASEARPDSRLAVGFGTLPDAGARTDCQRVTVQRTAMQMDYIEYLCETHAVIDESVVSMLQSVRNTKDQANAWLRAQNLWQGALDGITNMHYREADQDVRQVIAANRICFDRVIAQRQELLELLYPDQPQIVAEMINKLLVNNVIDQCEMW